MEKSNGEIATPLLVSRRAITMAWVVVMFISALMQDLTNGIQKTTSSPQSHLITGDFSSRGVTINGSLNSTQGISESSDVRLKKDIDPITLGLDAVLQLEGKTFKWSDESLSQETHIGLIAQDVEKVIPELVTEDENGFKAIAYAKLTTILIEAIKEQQGQMTTQQDQIASLEKENTQLKTIMAEQMDALLARVAMLEGESLAAN